MTEHRTVVGAAIPTTAITVVPGGPIQGALAAPSSKSVTNRMLVAAALADGVSLLVDPLASDDSVVMAGAVTALGAAVETGPAPGSGSAAEVGSGAVVWRVQGTGGRLVAPADPIDTGLSGTTMRFVTALSTLARGPVTVTGAPPLLRRPVGSLIAALRTLGAEVSCTNGRPPVTAAGGGVAGGEVTVDVSGSSQFASAVLLVAPYARADVVVRTRGAAAVDYIALTVATMRQWGADVSELDPGAWRVGTGNGYRAGTHHVEYDASAAAHLLAVAAATGGRVTVSNAATTLQPDAAITVVMEAMGAQVTRDDDAVTVEGPDRLAPVDVDLSGMPDQVTTIAVLAALADGTSEIRGVGVARTHETDRLAALTRELGKIGVRVEEAPAALTIHGRTRRPGKTRPARLNTYDDHRLAMAFAALAARVPALTIEEPWCVSKTYPAFWTDLRTLGVAWHPENP
ncbi:3-phosphoshikimate 1-carboxyvinyltransferase [soil metagenome]